MVVKIRITTIDEKFRWLVLLQYRNLQLMRIFSRLMVHMVNWTCMLLFSFCDVCLSLLMRIELWWSSAVEQVSGKNLGLITFVNFIYTSFVRRHDDALIDWLCDAAMTVASEINVWWYCTCDGKRVTVIPSFALCDLKRCGNRKICFLNVKCDNRLTSFIFDALLPNVGCFQTVDSGVWTASSWTLRYPNNCLWIMVVAWKNHNA